MLTKEKVFFIYFFVFLAVFGFSFLISRKFSKGEELKFSSSSSKSSQELVKKNEEIVSDELPKTEECPLNGQLFSKKQREKWEKRRPLGVMIENHVDSRPQSGISSADVVFEIVAEGGITRFLAIYYCQDASYVGPVRSARIYFIKILEGFGNYPLYAHVGGANTPGPADALGYLVKLGWVKFNDLNQFSVPFPYFWRDYERLPNRATEHTVYSSTAKLWEYASSKRGLTNVDDQGLSWDEGFVGWRFQDELKEDLRGDIDKIDFGFWSSSSDKYSVIWEYDKKTNAYKRFTGGEKHLDRNNNKQLTTKNVLILFSKESPANDGYPGGHLLYQVTGKGPILFFANGQVTEGFWQRSKESELFRFFNQKGDEIAFVRGQIFIEVLPLGNKVSY